MFFSGSRLFYDRYRLNSPKGNFDLKITEEQLIYQFANDIIKVFPEFISLPHKFKLNFAKRILKFLKQYKFVEKENVELTHGHKISIAASYIKLTLGFTNYLINTFDSILVYPTATYFSHLNQTHTGHFNPKMKVIMLALDEYQRDIYFNADGKDVALHEFTHALCFEMLQTKAKHPNAENFKHFFRQIQQWFSVPENRQAIEKSNFLRTYAYSDPLELISVLIELFFEKEKDFKLNFPDLFFLTGNMIKHPKLNSKT